MTTREETPHPRLSIVIVNADTREWLKGCLDSLERQGLFEEFEVVVVDNASSDGSMALLRESYPWVEAVRLDDPVGFGEANNAGARRCRGPWLLFLNPDTVVPDGSLAELLHHLGERPDCQVAGGSVLDSEGELERSTGSYPTVTSLLLETVLKRLPALRGLLGERSLQHWTGYDRERVVGWVTGAYLWIRRDLFEALEGFDEEIHMYCEDIDLCYRARRAGHPTWYFPVGRITHFRGRAPTSRSRDLMRRTSQLYFVRQHYRAPRYWLTRFVFRALARV